MKGLYIGIMIYILLVILWFFEIFNYISFTIVFLIGVAFQIISLINIYLENKKMLVKIEKQKEILTERDKILADLKTHKIKGITKCGKGLMQGLVLIPDEEYSKEFRNKIKKEMEANKNETFLFPLYKELNNNIIIK